MPDKKNILFSLIVFLAGQFYLFYFNKIILPIIITIAAVLILFSKQINGWLLDKRNLNVVLTFFAISFAIIGFFNIGQKNVLSFMFFLFSAIVLLIIRVNNHGFLYSTDINFNKQKILKWEIFYILIIIFASYFLYFHKSDIIPSGAVFHEGAMAAHFPELEGRNYIPYMPDDQANWSTFVFYLGLFFTKLFGYNIGSVRIPSAIFALLSVLAFYFLLRRITSSVTAALITPLFMANECFISLSRQFYPVTVLFLAPLLGAYFIIEGLHKNKWYYFLLSGLAVGYSLHGYLSGRPIVLTFIIWLFVLFIIYKNKNILKYSAVFLAGFAITALPVIWTSIVKPDVAWHYVHFTDPRKGADIFGRIDQFLDAIIPHLRLFYTGGDVESLLKPAGDPFFSREPMALILFTAGFLFCCLTFFKPVPLLLLLLLFFSLLPGFMSGYAMLKRSSMAIPVIFLISGFMFERIRFVFDYYTSKKVKIFLTFIMSISVFLSVLCSTNGFFNINMKDPGIKNTFNYSFFKISELMKENETATVYINPLKNTLGINVGATILFPKNSYLKFFKFNHEILYDNSGDTLFIFEPFMESAMDLFKKIYLSADIYVYKEEKTDAKFYKSGLSPWEKYYDHYNPYCYVVAMKVKADDIKNIQQTLIDKSSDNEKMVNISDDNFAQRYSNQKLDLNGMFLVNAWQNKKEIKINFGWDKWEIRIDDNKIGNNDKVKLDGGVHFLNLKGVVPEGRKGRLPLSVMENNIDIIKSNLMVAMSEPYGMKLTYFDGTDGWKNNPPQFLYYEFLYLKRFFDFPLSFPFSVIFEGKIKVDENSDYFFQNDQNMKCQIFINNKLVYDNINSEFQFQPIQKSIKLMHGIKYDIKVYQNFYYTRPNFNTMIIYYKKNQDDKIKPVPAEWITFF